MDARLAANELMDAGATSLKVYFRLSVSQVAAIIEEADRRNVPVHGHLEIVDPTAAIRLGLDGIEHTRSVGRALVPPKQAEEFRQAVLRESIHRGEGGLELWAALDPAGPRADALIELMLERNVNLDGTLAVFEPEFSEEDREVQWAAMRNMAAFTVRYAKAGGPVTMGSHGLVANAPPGLAYQREMETHVEAGMTPAETLIAATRAGAEALRLSRQRHADARQAGRHRPVRRQPARGHRQRAPCPRRDPRRAAPRPRLSARHRRGPRSLT